MSKQPLSKSQIFIAVAEIADPQQRSRLLVELCGDDDALRREIEELLARERQLGNFIDSPPSELREKQGDETQTAAELSDFAEPAADSGMVIGPYKLLQRIGEGGMGTVWMAEQERPVRRRVALKLIKSGVDNKQVLARFEAERQALALMDHPNVARIIDAGTTDKGQPYFAMELVQGMPLTKYCDQNRLGISDRLKLFAEVCSGVQHAHQKGIIHRDLKPSNILVTEVDGKPVPKVIDFGLAKALENTQRLTDQSMFTGIGQVLGTLKYMSPEQASLDLVDIDTRTDIYALGVILYELLTGSTPLDDVSIRNQAVLKVLGLIREQEPIRPSRRLQDTGEELSSITNLRRTDSSSLNRILVGDLDWVVVKALEKDRTRRYESASGLAADVQRFLNNEPVVARPPSLHYRVGKFVRKNRGVVIAASALATALVLGIIGTSWGLREAIAARNDEKRRADGERKANVAAQEANAVAQKRLTQIERGNEDLYSIFEGLDIRQVREGLEPLEAILSKRLVKVARELNADTVGDESVLAKLHNRLGKALTSLGYPDEAIPILERSWAKQKSHIGKDSDAALETGTNLSGAHSMAGHFDEAHKLDQELFELTKARFGPDHDETFFTVINLAHGAVERGEHDAAITLVAPVYDALLARHGPAHEETVRAAHYLATALIERAQMDRARAILQEAVPHAEKVFGPNHPDTITIKQNLAVTYARQGQTEQSLALMEEVLDLRRARQGADHPATLQAMVNVATARGEVGRFAEAVTLLEETLPLLRKKRGADHPDTLVSANYLVEAYKNTRQPKKAMALIQETLELSKSSLEPDHPIVLGLKANLAMCHWSVGEFDLAIQQYEELLAVEERRVTRGHPDTLMIIANLGVNHKDAGRPEVAIPLLEEVHSASAMHPNLRSFRTPLLECYLETNNSESAQLLTSELVDEARESHASGSVPLAAALGSVGKTLLEHQQYDDAEPLLRECLTISQERRPEHWVTFVTQSLLGEALAGKKMFVDAEPCMLKGYEGLVAQQATIPPHAPPEMQLPAVGERIARFYTSWHQSEPGKGYDTKADEWRQKLNQ